MKALILAVLFLVGTNAWSIEYHHVKKKIDIPRETYNVKGIAAGIAAAQCHHNISMKRLQGCAGFGEFDGSTAHTFGLAKRFGKILINGSVTVEGDTRSLGLGANWAF